MDDISNRTLALLLVTAIVISLGTTVYTLNMLGQGASGPTGRASSDTGQVNLTVESTLSIKLNGLNKIDFGSGYVNSSCIRGTSANLTVDASGYADQGDCWASQVVAPNEPTQPFRIENDGNQNVTLQIRCPDPRAFFMSGSTPYGGANPYNLTWKGRANETSVACPAASLTSTWGQCSGSFQTVCNTNFNYFPDSADEVAVDINVVIPVGLTAQEYKNASITFRAQ